MDLTLSKTQIKFLKLFALNNNDYKITSFLEISETDLINLKKSLTEKFYTNCFIEILIICVEYKKLDYKDFLEDSKRKIIEDYVNKGTKYYANNYKIRLQNCHKEMAKFHNVLYQEKELPKKLTTDETVFLRYKYNGHTQKDIQNLILINDNQYQYFEKIIFVKLSSTNWFNAFKKAYLYRIINNDIKTELKLIKKIANETTQKKQIGVNKKSLTKAHLYNNMITVFSQLEFIMLCKLNYKPTDYLGMALNNKLIETEPWPNSLSKLNNQD